MQPTGSFSAESVLVFDASMTTPDVVASTGSCVLKVISNGWSSASSGKMIRLFDSLSVGEAGLCVVSSFFETSWSKFSILVDFSSTN